MNRYNHTALFHRFLTATVLILATAGASFAQQKIDPTVEVEKEFDGKMTNIVKGALNSSISDSLTSFNLDFNYTIFDKPYKDLYEFTPLPSARIQSAVQEKYPVLLAKAGLGFPLNPFAAIAFEPRLKGGNSLSLRASYDGYYGDNNIACKGENGLIERVSGEKRDAANSVFGAKAGYGYRWNGGELNLGAHYSNNFYTYYGCAQENMSHKYDQLGLLFNIFSTHGQRSRARLDYRFDIEYRNTSDKMSEEATYAMALEGGKLAENYIKATGALSPLNGRYNRFSIGLNSENVLYSGLKEYNYGIYEIIPQYELTKGRLSLRAGVKLSGRYRSNDSINGSHRYLFAKADLMFNIVRNNLWIYAAVDGGNHMNSYSQILEQNRWISPLSELRTGSTPFLIRGGFKGQAYGKLHYDVFVKYAVHKGMMQFMGHLMGPDSSLCTIDAIYSNHTEFTAGASINWKSKAFDAGTSFRYSAYSNAKNSTLANGSKPYGYSPFNWFIYGRYNWRERIFIGIAADFNSSTPIMPGYKAKGYCNLGIDARYLFNRNFSLFLRGDNLLNAQIQHIPEYLEKGVSFTAGVLVKL